VGPLFFVAFVSPSPLAHSPHARSRRFASIGKADLREVVYDSGRHVCD
jgi:hypothetical protein